jgi:hypothetical protein
MRYRHTLIAVFLAAGIALATGPISTNTFKIGGHSARAEGLERAPLVVHEWGTFTSIAGEDGSPVEWLPQLGPSDLPCFVERSPLTPKASLFSTVRMETPVLYFYSSQEAIVDVSVGFQQGLITEWFPRAQVTPQGPIGPLPRDPGFAGAIHWRDVRITPGATEEFPTEPGASHYYAARRTDASPVQVRSQREKFLFYRGVSRFPVPLSATVEPDGRIIVSHREGKALGTLLLFQNHGGSIAYQVREEPGASATFSALVPDEELTAPLADLETLLVAKGLYPKEAKAMVETWRDSWFEDGVRLSYIMPQPAVDAILPLDITPRPTEVARVFVGRVELVTPAMLEEVRAAVRTGDRSTLQRYGRFLQPIGQRLVANSAWSDRATLEQTLQRMSLPWTTSAADCKTSHGGAPAR